MEIKMSVDVSNYEHVTSSRKPRCSRAWYKSDIQQISFSVTVLRNYLTTARGAMVSALIHVTLNGKSFDWNPELAYKTKCIVCFPK